MVTPKIYSLVFADLDKAFAVVGADGFIGRWKLPSFEEIKVGEDPAANWTNYKAVDFVKEQKNADGGQSNAINESDQYQLGVVGTDDRGQ